MQSQLQEQGQSLVLPRAEPLATLGAREMAAQLSGIDAAHRPAGAAHSLAVVPLRTAPILSVWRLVAAPIAQMADAIAQLPGSFEEPFARLLAARLTSLAAFAAFRSFAAFAVLGLHALRWLQAFPPRPASLLGGQQRRQAQPNDRQSDPSHGRLRSCSCRLAG